MCPPSQFVTPTPDIDCQQPDTHMYLHSHNSFLYTVNRLSTSFAHDIKSNNFSLYSVNAILDPLPGKEAETKKLINGNVTVQDHTLWTQSLAKEFGRLVQGYNQTKLRTFI